MAYTYDWTLPYESEPAGTDAPSGGDDEFRKLKLNIRERLESEHYFKDSQTNDGKHLLGSARAWVTNATPTQPNGSALNATIDTGRIWYNDTSGGVLYYTGANFQYQSYFDTNLEVTGTLTVGGITTFGGDMIVAGDLSVATNLDVGGNATVDGTLTVAGNTDINGTIDVASDGTIGGDLSVGTNLDVGGTLTVSGATTISSTLNVAGTLDVTGASDFASTATFAGAVTVTSNLTVTGTFAVDTLALNTVDSNLNVTGDLTVDGAIKGDLQSRGTQSISPGGSYVLPRGFWIIDLFNSDLAVQGYDGSSWDLIAFTTTTDSTAQRGIGIFSDGVNFRVLNASAATNSFQYWRF